MECEHPYATNPNRRVLHPPAIYSLPRSLSDQRMGPGDPTLRFGERVLEIAALTPRGPGSMRTELRPEGALVFAWGEGGSWLAEHAPELLGFSDPASDFSPPEGPARRLWRRAPGLRLARYPSVYVRTVQAVLQQLVTTKEALRSWRRLVGALGKPAPGPLELMLPPAPEDVAGAPSHLFSSCGIAQRRARTLRLVARFAKTLESSAQSGWSSLEPELLGIPGVGPWTAEYVRGSALADPDAVILGDYGLPHSVAWALAGEPRSDDQRMVELLEPFRGNRYRVIRLVHAAGGLAPRRGHRRPITKW